MHLLAPANIAGELYTRALTNAYRRGVRIYDPDYAHIQDPEAYEKMRRDPEIAHAMQFRRHLVAGRDWIVIPASTNEDDEKAASIMTAMLTEIRRFSSARFNLADAIFRGSAFAKIEGHRIVRDYGDGVRRKWWVPKRLKDMDRWRFRQVPVTQTDTLRTRWEFWDTSTSYGSWVPLTRAQRQLLISHVYFDTEATLGYGRGLLEALYHFYWAKTQVIREGLQGIERWAQGWIVAEIEELREASTDKTNADQVEEWLDFLEKMRSRHAAVHGAGDKITVHETTGQGHEIVMSMLQYLDQAMVRLILAGLLPTGGAGDSFGSFARAQEESKSQEMLMQYDREIMGEDITRDLVGLLWRLNRPNFVALGLGDARMPRFRIQQETRTDPSKEVEIAVKALQAGLPLRRDEVYKNLGYTPPVADDEVIDPATLGGAGNQPNRDPLTGQFIDIGQKDGATDSQATDVRAAGT